MNELTEKIRQVEADIAADKGSFTLFAFLEREDLSNRWDLVVAAPWAKDDNVTLDYVFAAMKRHLAPRDFVYIARIVVLDASDDPVRALTERFDVEHGSVELLYPQRFGLPVRFGYIITSRRAA